MTEQQRRAIIVAEVTGIKDRAEFAQVACDLMTESSRLMAAVVAE
jgi:hypothetical protein